MTTDDYVLQQRLERDICLLYHQLADYSFVMGDLNYREVFGLPYWEYLKFPAQQPVDCNFIRDGCLMMILAMSWGQIDGSDAYVAPHIRSCRDAVERVSRDDADTKKFVRTVLLALEIAEKDCRETPELRELSAWAYDRYVRGNFRRMAEAFDGRA